MNPSQFNAQHDALAWIGPDASASRAFDAQLTSFADSDDFLLAPKAFDFSFYIVQLSQQGVCGTDLIRLIRRRSAAGIVALCNRAQDDFVIALDSGADVVLDAAAPTDHLVATISAVRRRLLQVLTSSDGLWTLQEEGAILQAPDGTLIPLSDSDLTIMRCFMDVQGGRVDRAVLIERLWGDSADKSMDNALHATLYRLRKRIEHAGQVAAPVHAVSRLGYEFRAPLVRG